MSRIQSLWARKILDSRGNPTVEVDIWTEDGFGSAAAPSGASTGAHEVQAFPPQGVDFAVRQFKEEFAPALKGMNVFLQRRFDVELKRLDGTSNFRRMGGNVAVAASLALARAAANTLGVPLYQYLGGAFAGYCIPYPLANVLGGGRHARGGTDIQEFLVISFGPTVADCVFANALIHKKVGEALGKKLSGAALGKGDEGAWVARIGNIEALELVSKCCAEVSRELGFQIQPALDFAASELYRNERYCYKEKKLTREKQLDFVEKLVRDYNLYLVEDPLEQEDFHGYVELTERIGRDCLVVGDDLFVTSTKRIKKGIDLGACNAVLIKPNQVGTLSDTYDAVCLAEQSGYKTVISHRSGETEDNCLAHLGVAFSCHAIKTGAVGGERCAKLNELIRIQEIITKEKEIVSGGD
ncbi:MAG: enolase C-terminal domain-like protein [Thermoplasmata archaeon]